MPVTYVRNQNGEFELVGPGGASTDITLSQVGKPADAAAVGEALSGYATEAYVSSQINTKVDKVDGKGLSTNDYTTAEKTKLSGIATGANKYTLPTATSSVLGGVKIGSNITSNSGTISLSSANVISALGYTPEPEFSTLPVAQGGTGQTKAWTNGTVSSLNSTTVTSAQFAVFPYLNKAFIRLNIQTPRAIAADDAEFIALPSTIPTAHTALACYNEIGYDIHAGVSSVAGKGVYIMNSGTSSMPKGTRLYIAGWYSV